MSNAMRSSIKITTKRFKEDLVKNGSSLDQYLQLCLTWLKDAFPQINSFSVSDKQKFDPSEKATAVGRKGYLVGLCISVKDRKARGAFANEVLSAFDKGPLFIANSLKSKTIDFLWLAGKDKVKSQVKDLSDIDYARKTRDYLSSGGQSSASLYSFAYYSFTGTKDELKKLFSKPLDFSQTIKLKEAVSADKRIVAKCIVDFTIENDRNEKASDIANADEVIDRLKSVLKIKRIDRYEGTKPYNSIAAVSAKSVKDKFQKLFSKGKAFQNELDRSFYGALFNAILNGSVDFKMNSLKSAKVEDKTFADIIAEEMKYGAITAELLVPFLLLFGYRKIDGKDILKGLSEEAKVVSVEFPASSKNVLTDYDAVFKDPVGNAAQVVSSDGKRWAVSAKWTDMHNASALFGLIHDNLKTFGKTVLDSYAKKAGKDSPFAEAVRIAERVGDKNERQQEVLDLASNPSAVDSRFVNKLAKSVSFSELKRKKYGPIGEYPDVWIKENGTQLLEKFKAEFKTAFRKYFKNKGDDKINIALELFPYSAAFVCDKALTESLNENKDFLLTVYSFIFGYYGEDVEFQQIQLNKDLSIKYIAKSPDVSKKNVSDFIRIESVGSIKREKTKDYIKQVRLAQPMRVMLLK